MEMTAALPVLFPLIFAVQANLTWFDPKLGGINCDHDCTTLASHVRFSDALYDRVAACPPEFPFGTRFVIAGSWRGLADGEYECLDRGGMVVTRGGVISLDLLRRDPVWRETIPVTVIWPEWLNDAPDFVSPSNR